MDDELRAAYDRLDDALAPPGDTAALVAVRVATRSRRRRSAGAAAGAVAVMLGVAGVTWGLRDGGAAPTPGPAAPVPSATESFEAPSTTPTPTDEYEPTASTAELTCSSGTVVGIVTNPEDYLAGAPYGPETVRPWLLPEAYERFYRVDADQVVARLVTQKGDVYAELGLIAIDDAWRVESLAACTSAYPGLRSLVQDASTNPRASLTAVPENHCWIQTLETLGRSWDLRDEDQFGFGGLGPDGFLGIGQAYSVGDRLSYVDLSGARLTFVPADSPGTDANEGICD